MFSNRLRFVLVGLIVISAFLLRFYATSRIPPSLSWDEVSIGYNAYSILKTGLDEHGKFFPIDAFAGYGDYKPPLAIYLTVPFVAIFGLSEAAVRFPSALFGTLTVLMTFFLVRELFKKEDFKLPALSALLLSISPWHINLSRAGFEANIALFFIVLGVLFVLKARKRAKFFIVAWVPFALSMYTFNSARYFVIFFGVALLIYAFSFIKKHMLLFLLGLCLAAVILAPLVPHLLSKEARLRFVEVNIFTDASVVKMANERIERGKNSVLATALNNRRVLYARSYLLHFFDNLQPEFLFIKGDGNPKFSIQDVGQLYIMEAPFLVIGIIALFVAYPTVAALLLFWLLSSIIPAATARETPHALRILNSLPTWQIFIAFGILTCGKAIKEWGKKIKPALPVFIFIVIGMYAFSITYYLHNYYRHYPLEYSGEWQYGYREAIAVSEKIKDKYDTIVISESIGRPYMYTLFYTKTDPRELIRTKDATFDAAGFYHVYGFGKYRFGGTLPSPLDPHTLYIWNSVPEGSRVIETIRLLNGIPVLVIFDKE